MISEEGGVGKTRTYDLRASSVSAARHLHTRRPMLPPAPQDTDKVLPDALATELRHQKFPG